MPGLVKIGYTNRSAAIRADELFYGTPESRATGVPMPFKVVKDWRVPANRAKEVEQHIHRMLDASRVPSHARGWAKEFFHFQPQEAVFAIERALQELDWWSVAAAEVAQFDAAVEARERRRAAEREAQRQADERERQIRSEIEIRKTQWRESAAVGKAAAGKAEGLKWGSIWFVGSCFVLFGLNDAKEAALWLCFAIGAFAYYLTKGGPANAFLSSQEARDKLDEIEAEVRRGLSVSGQSGQQAARPNTAGKSSHSTDSRVTAQVARHDSFPERFAKAQALIQQRSGSESRGAGGGGQPNSAPIAMQPVPPVSPSGTVQPDANSTASSAAQAEPGPGRPLPATARATGENVPHDLTCPRCRKGLTVRLPHLLLTQKIRCPLCTHTFLFKEGRNPQRQVDQPREDLEHLHRDAY